MLALENLGIASGRTALLSGIDAVVRPGRITAIVGPNGAGKSTLLSCLAGLRKSDQGRTLIDGAPLTDLGAKERARRIGYLPQDAPLHWNIAVRALVALGRFPHADACGDLGRLAIDRALTELALFPFANRLVGTLSGGERARAMLARVLAGEPDWILADEPLAALDPAHRYALMGVFRSIAARGVGIVLVLHDLTLAAAYADDALLLDHGRLVAEGPVAQVLTPERLGPVFGVHFDWVRADDGTRLLLSRARTKTR